MASPGKRHPLLLYRRLFAMLRPPTFFIALFCGVLWWFAPNLPWLSSEAAQFALLITTVLCGMLFLYTLIGPALAYVQCFPTHLRVSTPLFRLAISYSRMGTARPVQFTPWDVRWSQRRFLEPFLGATALLLDLKRYPLSERWLRLWLNEYMFPHNATGLIFHTPDWMALSREIESYRSEWKTRPR
jgi:hypothetical protein